MKLQIYIQQLMAAHIIVDNRYLKNRMNLSSSTYLLIIYEISSVNKN